MYVGHTPDIYKRSASRNYSLGRCVAAIAAVDLRDCDTVPPLSPSIVTLALQPETFGAGPQAVAKMAQPTAEPIEDYEYVLLA
ncbi:Fe(2+) transporter [Diatrype stigma]|uniref:Fe(2+) transporter n=1 Tax=Diatrype stigma TaxID=117547 RepID=A0AAN9YSC7_9PEZI